MPIARVQSIFRYPIKSLGGESLAHSDLALRGLPGDRGWAVRDEVRGGIRGGKKLPGLMRLRARATGPALPSGSLPAEIELPDGSVARTSDPDVAERISAAIDHPVTLWPLLPADARDHYRRGAPTHAEPIEELREIFGRTRDEPLPDLSKLPRELFEYESPPGTYFDAYPLLVMTRASLETLARRVSACRFDVRRFRPNLLLEATRAGVEFPERDWIGARLAIGSAVIRIEAECPRCVMTTHGFDDLPRDPGIMRALVREAGGSLGVYASVNEPGRVRAGDPVELRD